jgi:TP901 family phage tail tape measure protein
VSVRLQADVGSYVRGLRDATHVTQGLGRSIDDAAALANQKSGEMARAQQRQLDGARQLGTGLVVVGAGIAAGLGLATKAAIDWESAWTGVAKTVDGSEAELAALEGDLRELATVLPATHQEIAAVAEAAGQLGVATGDIASFTETMIALGESTNLTADEAATSIAQLMNVMGTAPQDVGRLGAALVELGNNGASTEREIVMMAQRIAGAGAIVGASEADILALSNALASVGIEVEAGGSAISRVLIDISQAAAEGGEEIEAFARVAGQSAQDFAEHFQRDPVAALDLFIQGLGRMSAAGENVFGVLEDLGLGEIRTRDALLRLASSGDLLTQSLADGSRAWQENIALTEEAGRRYGTAEARLQIARNQVNDFAIDMGQVFMPAIADAAEAFGGFVGLLSSVPEPVQEAAGVIAAIAAGMALVSGGALIGITRIARYRESLVDLGLASDVASKGSTRLARGLQGTMVWAGRATAALVALQIAGAAAAAVFGEEFAPQMEAFTLAVADFGRDGEVAGEAARVLGSDLSNLEEALRVLGPEGVGPGVGNAIKSATEWIFQLDSVQGSLGRSREQLDAYDQALASLVQSGRAADATAAFERLSEVANENGVSTERLIALLPAYAAAQEVAAAGAEEATGPLDAVGEAAANAAANVEELRSQFDALFGIAMDADRAAVAFEESLDAINEQLQGTSENFDIATEAGRENVSMVLDHVEAIKSLFDARAEEEGVTEELIGWYNQQIDALEDLMVATGMERGEAEDLLSVYRDIQALEQIETAVSAPGLAETDEQVIGYHEHLAQIPEDEQTGISTPGLSSAANDVNAYTDDVNAIPGSRQTRISAPGVQGWTQSVLNFVGAVNSIPPSRQVNVHTRYTSSGGGGGGGLAYVERWGGVYENATGGVYSAQRGLLRRAAIFPPQAPARFAFAEPATGGEAFVPKLGDRQRSLSILSTAAGWYGAQVVPGQMRHAQSLHAAQTWSAPPTGASGGATATPAVDQRDLARIVAREVGQAIDGARLVVDDRGRRRLEALQANYYQRAG